MEAGARVLLRACKHSRSIRTGCRSGRATARVRPAARASARFHPQHARLREAVQLGLHKKTEAEFVDAVLSGQPEPPKYFAKMKRVNKKARRSSAVSRSPQTPCRTLPDLIAAGACHRHAARPGLRRTATCRHDQYSLQLVVPDVGRMADPDRRVLSDCRFRHRLGAPEELRDARADRARSHLRHTSTRQL